MGDQGIEAQRPPNAPSAPGSDAPLPGLTGLRCSIQFDRQGQANPTELPTDVRQGGWRIFIPGKLAGLGAIAENDIATDDFGKRFLIYAAWWDSLGYQIRATLELL